MTATLATRAVAPRLPRGLLGLLLGQIVAARKGMPLGEVGPLHLFAPGREHVEMAMHQALLAP